jgi:hypothetical protein
MGSAGPQLMFTFGNRFFCHQGCYGLLPASPGYMSCQAKRLGMLISGCPLTLPQNYVFITLQYWRSVFGHSVCDWDQIQNLYYKCLHTIRIKPRNEEASNNHNGFKFRYQVSFLCFFGYLFGILR